LTETKHRNAKLKSHLVCMRGSRTPRDKCWLSRADGCCSRDASHCSSVVLARTATSSVYPSRSATLICPHSVVSTSSRHAD